MKTILFPLLLLCSFNLTAAELSTPHTFTAGTPALASQVNENFQAHADTINTKTPLTIVKVNGQKIGWIYSRNDSNMVVVSDKGSMTYLSTNGEIANTPEMHNMRAFYESADCSGQPYVVTNNVVWEYNVFRDSKHLIFWDSVSLLAYYTVAPAQLITANSLMYTLEVGCFPFSFGQLSAYLVKPNNPEVTGFTFIEALGSLMLENISFEIQQ